MTTIAATFVTLFTWWVFLPDSPNWNVQRDIDAVRGVCRTLDASAELAIRGPFKIYGLFEASDSFSIVWELVCSAPVKPNAGSI